VAEFTVTAVTLAPIPLARGSLAKALIAAANLLPFCKRVALSVAEVLELKNFSQFAVISAIAAELPVPELLGAAELPVAAGDEADDEEAGALELAADVLELLLQAATVAASARPSAVPVIRRARRLNRMTRLLCLGRMYC